jgi:CheY-like chemotaxis protein
VTPRILIVDDSRTTLEVVKIHLMSRGYEFIVASDGAKAFELMHRTPPDLVISDLAMPGVSGVDLCKKIRTSPTYRGLPFVIVTANKDDKARREAFAAGVDGFMRKPIEASRLQFLVSELLNRQRSVAGQL